MSKLVFYAILLAGILCFGIHVSQKWTKLRQLKRYGRLAHSVILERYLNKLYRILSKSKVLTKINEEIAYKISVFNTAPFEKNSIYAAIFVTVLLFLIGLISILLIYIFLPYWYIAFLYLIVISAALLFILQFISDGIMRRYLKHMPEVLRILQSRFISKGSISKAIHVSIPDFPKGIRMEMIRIYDALKLNNTDQTRAIFQKIDQKYSDEHMSELLELIWLAHYHGGSDAVRDQFEAMLNDVIEDLEGKKDLRGATMSYTVLSVLFMAALPFIKIYNGAVLDPATMEYYHTRSGMLLAAIYVAFLIAVIAILLYLEKRG